MLQILNSWPGKLVERLIFHRISLKKGNTATLNKIEPQKVVHVDVQALNISVTHQIPNPASMDNHDWCNYMAAN